MIKEEQMQEGQDFPKKKKPVRRRSEVEAAIREADERQLEQRPRKKRRSDAGKPVGRKRPDGEEPVRRKRPDESGQSVRRKRPDRGESEDGQKRQSVKKMAPKQPREWTTKARWITGLKYGVTALILGYVIFLLVLTGGTSKSFDEVEKGVESTIDVSSLNKGTGQDLKRYYGLNSADYRGFMIYESNSSVSAEEILMIEVADEKQLQDVQNAIQDRITNRKAAFEGYAQEQADLVDASIVSVRGNYIFFTVSKNASANKKAFADSL